MEDCERKAHKYEIELCNGIIGNTPPGMPVAIAELYIPKRAAHIAALAAERATSKTAELHYLPVPASPAQRSLEVIAA
jgi:hypothetical protein